MEKYEMSELDEYISKTVLDSRVFDPDVISRITTSSPYTTYTTTSTTTGPLTYDLRGTETWTSTLDPRAYKPEIENEDRIVSGTLGNGQWFTACSDEDKLSEKNILKSLAEMRAILNWKCRIIHVHKMECSMTPIIKDRLINAYRKYTSYGKKTPFMACFDEFGQRLPDVLITEGTADGMTVKIIDPSEFGELFLKIDVNPE